MVSQTPRFQLNIYTAGETGWTHEDAVEAIDELAIARGAAADRPATGEYPNELYAATDEGTIYRWDGDSSSWATFAGISLVESVESDLADHEAAANPHPDSAATADLFSGSYTDLSNVPSTLVQTDDSEQVTGTWNINTGAGGDLTIDSNAIVTGDAEYHVEIDEANGIINFVTSS